MELLIANSSGVLKRADGSAASWFVQPGRRYAVMVTGIALVTAGEITPLIDGFPLPGDATDSNTSIAWTCGATAPSSVGCEFVATGTQMTILGTGFTATQSVNISIVPIED